MMTTRTGKLFASTAIYLIPIGAMAADLPVRSAPAAPVMTVLPFSWTGVYVGVQAGWQGFQYDSTTTVQFGQSTPDVGGRASADSSGFVGGAHVGFNYQINSLVLGLEADIEYVNGGKRVGLTDDRFSQVGENGFDWDPQIQGSIRARLGFAVDRVLFYATGGLAILEMSTTYFNTGFGRVQKFDETLTGWTLGVGIEYAISNNWSARLEYRYTDYGDFTHVPAVSFNPEFSRRTFKNELTANAVRVGLSYRFGAPAAAPVVARY